MQLTRGAELGLPRQRRVWLSNRVVSRYDWYPAEGGGGRWVGFQAAKKENGCLVSFFGFLFLKKNPSFNVYVRKEQGAGRTLIQKQNYLHIKRDKAGMSSLDRCKTLTKSDQEIKKRMDTFRIRRICSVFKLFGACLTRSR